MTAPVRTIAALAGLALVLGSVHAFSVLVEPLGATFDVGRAEVSLTYSLALIAITALVSLGHRTYARLAAWQMVCVVAVLGAAGAGLSAVAGSLWLVWLGYGLIFGAANGLGYGYGLQLAAQVWPGREGMAMGVITAAYAIGATVFPFVNQSMLDAAGLPGAMLALAVVLLLTGGVAAMVLRGTGAHFQSATEARATAGTGIAVLWLAYATAVLAGLMTIGHAVGIAESLGQGAATLVLAPAVLALCNMAGSLGGGWLADRIGARGLLAGLPVLSTLALGGMASGIGVPPLLGLGAIGFVYGAVIAAYPAVIARRYGVAGGAVVYGQVFTGWAVAGLVGPVLAGWLFDRSGDYTLALVIAAALGLVSALTVLTGLRAPDPRPR